MLKIFIFAAIVVVAASKSLDAEQISSENRSQKPKISTNDFTFYKQLAKCGSIVYMVQKNGGSDDGKLYALKAQNFLRPGQLEYLDEYLNLELEILAEIREMPWTVTLHYAWREGSWLFLVTDLATGGDVQKRLYAKTPDFVTAQRIISETVVALETIHKANIIKGDFGFLDVLIESDGHTEIADFGLSKRHSSNEPIKGDWGGLSWSLDSWGMFPGGSNRTDIHRSIIEFLKIMTDAELPELKEHPFFAGIDWDMVAARKSVPPFEPSESHYDPATVMDPALLFAFETNHTLEKRLAERFPDYYFVATEHQD